MRLAILSDTHGLLRPEVLGQMETADAILHGGDINRQSVLDELERYAPLYVVRVHNNKEVPADLTGVDVVVFGHSHKCVQEERDGILWLNPGSCGPRRFHQEITMMMAEVADGAVRVEKISIPHPAQA